MRCFSIFFVLVSLLFPQRLTAYTLALPPAPAPAPTLPVVLKAEFAVERDSVMEPSSNSTLYRIKVTSTGVVGAKVTPTPIVDVQVLPTSSATADIDYRWVAKPAITFVAGQPSTRELVLEVLSDKVIDAREFLNLRLELRNGSLKATACNCAFTAGKDFQLIITAPPTSPSPPTSPVALKAEFAVERDSVTEPASNSALYRIKVSTTGSVASAGATPTVDVEMLSTSTATVNIDYRWVSKPVITFVSGQPTITELVLEVLPDKVTDVREFLDLHLELRNGSLNAAACNCAFTPGKDFQLIIKEQSTELPFNILSIGLGSNLNVIDKSTTGSNIYLDLMAFQPRINDDFRAGGYIRAFQEQGTTSIEGAALARFLGATLIFPTYTQIGPVRGDSLRVARTFKRATPKDPTVRSTGAVLSYGWNALYRSTSKFRATGNINAHLEWVRREVTVAYEQADLAQDSIYIPLRNFNTAPVLPSGRYAFTDLFVGIDFPFFYQAKFGDNSLEFKAIPGAGLANISLGGRYERTYYYNLYACLTEVNHGFSVGFDTRNVPDLPSKNLGFTVFAIKKFNLDKIGDLLKFGEGGE